MKFFFPFAVGRWSVGLGFPRLSHLLAFVPCGRFMLGQPVFKAQNVSF